MRKKVKKEIESEEDTTDEEIEDTTDEEIEDTTDEEIEDEDEDTTDEEIEDTTDEEEESEGVTLKKVTEEDSGDLDVKVLITNNEEITESRFSYTTLLMYLFIFAGAVLFIVTASLDPGESKNLYITAGVLLGFAFLFMLYVNS